MTIVTLEGPTANFEGTSTSDPNFLSWTITLDTPATETIDVGYRLLAGTGGVATSSQDNGNSDVYGNLESFVRFAAGEQSKTVSYRIDGDDIAETDEAVVLEVLGAVNGTNAQNANNAPVLRATGWILDDDATGNKLAMYVLGPDVLENLAGGSVASFDISLSRPANSDLSFTYTTVDGTAVAGDDYLARSGTISFTEGQTRTAVNVPIIGDAIVEFDETFTLDVTPTSALASGEAGTDGVGTIVDNGPIEEVATVSLSVSPVSAPEGDSGPQTAVTFTLSRSGDTTNAVTATLAASGSATAGSDYTGGVPTSLTIPAGATEASFTVTVQGDEDVEGDEAITVTIAGLDRADHGIGTASATHTIEEEPGEGGSAPVAADDAFTTDEDTALAGDLFADNGAGPDSDPDGDPIDVTAASVGGVALSFGVATAIAGGGRLTVGADGSLAFDPDDDFEALGAGDTATVEVAYTITDGDGSDDATATITIEGVNDAPAITSGAAFTIPENQTAVGSVSTTDAEGDTLSYTITGGADAALFDIDPTTGALSFLTAPDFESPADDGGDNVYDLTVSASDGTDSTSQNITVTVTDVEPEGPEPELIVGTPGIDYLVGTDAEERIEGRGGPLDQVLGGGGADVFVFEEQEGSRDVLAIRDFSKAEGDMLDLQGAEIAQEVVVGGSTYLILEGEDHDLIILDGVTGYDDLLPV
ncbi:cadherin domain-containing protein [Rhodovulum sulfidophilum]|uniref:Calx-beta domain-containing protein n=1 Tax=Rhodovulum sulfidophilum TaxID=35806 RepID=UPI0019203FD3|nr:Calx-beta domain-containing protein [Rhodovulum sulfidophilum]MBL3563837.1 cadherin domain-containing protein [Rhodovulum sulfidophilum]